MLDTKNIALFCLAVAWVSTVCLGMGIMILFTGVQIAEP